MMFIMTKPSESHLWAANEAQLIIDAISIQMKKQGKTPPKPTLQDMLKAYHIAETSSAAELVSRKLDYIGDYVDRIDLDTGGISSALGEIAENIDRK